LGQLRIVRGWSECGKVYKRVDDFTAPRNRSE